MDFTRNFIISSCAIILSACSGGGGSDSVQPTDDQKAIAITDGKGPILSVTSPNPSEDLSGSTNSIVIKLSQTFSKDVFVDYHFIDGTAVINEDFNAEDGVVKIPAGSSSISIDFTVVDDDVDENNESFTFRLDNPTSATFQNITALSLDTEIVIKDNDSDPVVTFSPPYQLISENNTEATIKMVLSHQTTRDAKIGIAVSGTAKLGDDFDLAEDYSEIQIQPGVLEYDITLNIKGDSTPEYGEVIYLELVDNEFLKLADDPIHTTAITDLSALNDTGMTYFYDGSSTLSLVESSDYPMQDANVGYDADPEQSDDNGVSGFSFTKIDHDGNPLPHDALEYKCIQDNRTGLVWERKQDADPYPFSYPTEQSVSDFISSFPAITPYDPYEDYGLIYWRSKSFKYYWHEPDNTKNSGSVGVDLAGLLKTPTNHPAVGSCGYPFPKVGTGIDDHCTSYHYTKTMNYYGICGFKDWRLPTAPELRSIVNYDPTQEANGNPVDPNFFNNNQAFGEYLTSSPDVNNQSSTWCLDMGTGQNKLCKKNNTHYVRAVRKGS